MAAPMDELAIIRRQLGCEQLLHTFKHLPVTSSIALANENVPNYCHEWLIDVAALSAMKSVLVISALRLL